MGGPGKLCCILTHGQWISLHCFHILLLPHAAVWQHLAAALVQAAALVVQHQQQLSELQQRRQALLPRSLHEARQQLQRRQRGEDSSREQQRWAALQQLTGEAVEAQGQLRLALQSCERCCAIMEVGEGCSCTLCSAGLSSDLQVRLSQPSCCKIALPCPFPQPRLWWRDAHLLPQPSETVAAALQTSSADPAIVLALAAVNAFLHPLWQRQAVQQWR